MRRFKLNHISARIAAALFFSVLLSACAASYNTNFPLLETGMAQSDVWELIGAPISAESGPEGTKIQYFKLASSFLDTDGSDTREYFVAFQGDKVIGYGERQDELTMQRSIIQFNSAWNAARTITNAARIATPIRVQVDVNQN